MLLRFRVWVLELCCKSQSVVPELLETFIGFGWGRCKVPKSPDVSSNTQSRCYCSYFCSLISSLLIYLCCCHDVILF